MCLFRIGCRSNKIIGTNKTCIRKSNKTLNSNLRIIVYFCTCHMSSSTVTSHSVVTASDKGSKRIDNVLVR